MGTRGNKPLYLECTWSQAILTWLGVFLNFTLISYSIYWLTQNLDRIGLDWPWFVAALLVGLFIADFLSGLVHWASDTWFDEIMSERVVSIAREHHIYPYHITGYGLRDYLGYSSWPAALLIGPVVLILMLPDTASDAAFLAIFICTEAAVFMVFGTYAHWLGHVRTRSRVVHFLRRCRFLISPDYHKVHHIGGRDVRYCVINGWANPICDRTRVWRGLEKLVHALTGAVPGRNDHEWSVRFAEDPSFMRNPVPSLLALRRRIGAKAQEQRTDAEGK